MNTLQPATTRVEPELVTAKRRHWLLERQPGRYLLPATGLLIMALDWLLFSGDVATFGLSVPILSVVGFLLGGFGTFVLQRRFFGDGLFAAACKSILAGIVVGVPWPLAGTLVGGWILLLSGLSRARNDQPASDANRMQQR